MGALRIANGKVRQAGGRVRQLGTVAAGTAATALTVNDFAADRIFQRVGTSKDVDVAGTFTGPASTVQARAVPVGTSLASTAYPWTNIGATFGAGTYSGKLNVSQGGWYTLQVRDAVDATVTASGAKKFCVGVLIGMIGQSNMVRLSELVGEYPLVDLKTRRFKDGAWSFVGNYNLAETYPPNTTVGTYGSNYQFPSPNGDGITYFVNYLRAALGVPVGTFEYAVSGSALYHWEPGGSLYTAFTNAITASGGDIEAAIFLQGEQDANVGTSEAAYKAGVLNMLNGLRAHVGRTSANFHLGIVLLGPGNGFAPVGRLGSIRKAQLEFVAATPGTYLSSIATDAELGGDSIHFDGASQRRQGKRYALGMAGRLGAVPYGAEGPRITGATRSGAAITVAIAQNGGTLLRDGAGGTGGGLTTSFRVFDNGTAATISSSAISGNSVVLTLASAPAGPVTLDYAMADAPFGTTFVPASAVYDNTVVPGDTRGLPLQPRAAITVTGS